MGLSQDVHEVFFSQRASVFRLEGVFIQKALLFLEAQDALFYGALGHELDHIDGSGLPQPMRPVRGLRFHRGIPPRIKMHHGVGCRKIQAGAAGP